MVSEEIKNPQRYARFGHKPLWLTAFSTVFSLQEYIAQHSSRGAVRHDDLCADERVVLDRPVGRRDDFGPRRSRRECIERYFRTSVFLRRRQFIGFLPPV